MPLTTEQISARIKELCDEEYLLGGIVPMVTIPEPALWILLEAEHQRDAALAESRRKEGEVVALREALEELIEVADLRGDSDLPHPADDPKLWTARMIDAWDGGREALSSSSATAQQVKEEWKRETLEKVWAAVCSPVPPLKASDCEGISIPLPSVRTAILEEA